MNPYICSPIQTLQFGLEFTPYNSQSIQLTFTNELNALLRREIMFQNKHLFSKIIFLSLDYRLTGVSKYI